MSLLRFYEWHVSGKEKQPYYIQLKDSVKPHNNTEEKQLLTMAGLFDVQYSEEVRIIEAAATKPYTDLRVPMIYK